MSKFAEKLGHIYKTAAPALGFRKPDAEAELPALLLIATIDATGAKKSKNHAENGMDAAIVHSKNIEAARFKELAAGVNNTPLGVVLDDGSQDTINELMKLDWDFAVFDLQAPVEAINKEGLGKILRIEPSMAPGLARAINELSIAVDGVLIDSGSSTVTLERLLACQFFASVIDRPLIVSVDSSLTSGELGSLHESGVKGLLLPEGTAQKTIAELKKMVSNLPKTPRRKAKTSVLLPRLGVPESKVEKHEEEEEEDI